MAKAPAFQFYPKQYVADKDVQAMEWDARGMYVHLLCMAWQEIPPGSIPNDDAVIRRWLNLSLYDSGLCQRSSDRRESGYGCRCSDCVWRRVRPQIMAAWVLKDGRWYQDGMCKTWERMLKRSEASTNNVRKRYQPYVEEVKEAVDPEVSKKISESYIAEIYDCYPRKLGKGHAYKAIASALRKLLEQKKELFHSLDDAAVYLKQRTKLFARSPAGQAGQYTPHPATWFNGERYLDDESEWSKYGQEPSKTEQRVTSNRQNIVAGLSAGANARPGGADRGQRDFAGRSAALVGDVQTGESGTD
jgi:hypothetical protein